MNSAGSVQRRRGRRKLSQVAAGRPRAAIVRVVTGDLLGMFATEILRVRPRRMWIVSPWIGERPDGRLASMLRHIGRTGVQLTVMSRGGDAIGPEAGSALAGVGARMLSVPQLHAKVLLCDEGGGRGVTLVGSANATAGSLRLFEVGLLVCPQPGSALISDLSRCLEGLAGHGTPDRQRNTTLGDPS